MCKGSDFSFQANWKQEDPQTAHITRKLNKNDNMYDFTHCVCIYYLK